jgi:hypothetical protein
MALVVLPDEGSQRQIKPNLLVILHQQNACSWIPKDEYLGGSRSKGPLRLNEEPH